MVYKSPDSDGRNAARRKRKTRQILLIAAMVVVVALIVLLVASLFKKPDPGLPQPPGDNDTIDFNGHLIPIITEIPPSPYQTDLFVVEDGIMHYDSDTVESYMGIDVSTFQEDIDWAAVRQAGVDFAMIRVGRRGATEGQIYLDDTFEYNVKQALQNDIDVGVYFFSQAVTVEEAQEEALMVLTWLKGVNITYPVVFDWEFMPHIEGSRTNGMTGEEITNCALAFCSVIEQGGYTPMIYFDLNMAYNYYDLARIGHIDFWVAEWHHIPPSFYYEFQMLQYTSRGEIPGIVGDVDLNISFVNYAAKKTG